MEIPNVPQVFFIKGVFKDTERSIVDILDTYIATEEFQSVVVPLLKWYADSEDAAWLEQRSILCATCNAAVTTRHIFVPESVEKYRGGLRYKCHDTCRFCSWWCAAHHIKYFINNDSRYKLLLTKLYESWEQKPVVEILPCISPWRILDFGGELTHTQFHKINEFNFSRFQSSFFVEEDDHEAFD
jgi:hypothetical protein